MTRTERNLMYINVGWCIIALFITVMALYVVPAVTP